MAKISFIALGWVGTVDGPLSWPADMDGKERFDHSDQRIELCRC